jgi:hypothetical protein
MEHHLRRSSARPYAGCITRASVLFAPHFFARGTSKKYTRVIVPILFSLYFDSEQFNKSVQQGCSQIQKGKIGNLRPFNYPFETRANGLGAR